jgi:DNA mismatch repair ATPase MutS
MEENIELSPLVKQFYELKAENPEALILFRTGDFYETYSEDAEESSKILGITLTKTSIRKDKDGEPLKIAGFPHHALDTYLPKLIRAGKRIAICEQLEDPYTKKLVK